ncbi:cupin-like domain-containing protein [uncultured Gilvimarinus sp.]|uniref:cupin-like domain-containing protein n=1 Tax=uncultured Gilvimarinus sp. TaxID=1689143 RepID=UPI0030D71017
MTAYKKIPEYRDLSADEFFSDVAPEQRPVVIRDFAKCWPVVNAAKQSSLAFANYLCQFYSGGKARIFVAPPNANKRFYYSDDMAGVNYIAGEERVDLFLGRLLELIDREVYPAISMQNALPSSLLPGFTDQNCSDFFKGVEPRLWIGNEGIVSAHYDGADNMACVVAGRRRFILFPPEQTANLYPGSLNYTPAGAPTSLVNLDAPDYDRYPRFKTALANAYCAELEPGDAIFIPLLWWHHVESLAKVNALMNCWWNASSLKGETPPSPLDSLNIALLAMRNLNQKQRNAWRSMFDHYVFKQVEDPAAYIPKQHLHLLGDLSADDVNTLRQQFGDKLKL